MTISGRGKYWYWLACAVALVIALESHASDGARWATDADVEWPANLPPAAAMYQCFRAARGAGIEDSVAIWSDRAGTVIAVASAREYSDIPAYANPLVSSAELKSLRPTKSAVPGYTVVKRIKTAPTLRVGALSLECIPSHDD